MLFCLIFVVLGLGLLVIFKPKITLIGKDKEVVSLNSNYIDLGTKEEVNKKGEVNTKVPGAYHITYYKKVLFFTFKKVREVEVKNTYLGEIDLKPINKNYCYKNEYKEDGFKALDKDKKDISDKINTLKVNNDIYYYYYDNNMKIAARRSLPTKDDIKPIIELTGGSVHLRPGDAYNEPGFKVSDNCSTLSDKDVSITNNIDNNKAGNYIVTYKVKDEAGNETEVSRKVSVNIEKPGTIYLTFDDGPSEFTPELLDILKKHNIKVSFFVTGRGRDELIKREHDEGHMIYPHTYTHDYAYVYSSKENYFEDLNKVVNRIKRLTGTDPKIFRFPGGASNTISRRYRRGIVTEIARELQAKGYNYVDWNISGGDSYGAQTSEAVYNNVINNLRKDRNNIVLLHDMSSKTINAVEPIINYAKNHNYHFDVINSSTNLVQHRINN